MEHTIENMKTLLKGKASLSDFSQENLNKMKDELEEMLKKYPNDEEIQSELKNVKRHIK